MMEFQSGRILQTSQDKSGEYCSVVCKQQQFVRIAHLAQLPLGCFLDCCWIRFDGSNYCLSTSAQEEIPAHEKVVFSIAAGFDSMAVIIASRRPRKNKFPRTKNKHNNPRIAVSSRVLCLSLHGLSSRLLLDPI
jgi:hypothetical protein